MEINNFEELITPNLNSKQKFVSYECKYLLPPGENYGSTMLQIAVKVKNSRGEEEIIHCVGKTAPPSEFLWEFFRTKQTFKKEIALYTMIVPEINNFAKERGVNNLLDFYARCLGARLSLDPKSQEVDKDVFLLLENLKILGYEMKDRTEGFDLESSKSLLESLATIHAGAIAFKTARPNDFKKMLPYLKKEYVFVLQENLIDRYIGSIENILKKDPECVKQFPKLEKAVRNMKYFVENPPQGREIFTTVSHNDFWTNNAMIKYDENGKPVKNVIVDFQLMEYNSLAHDVVFFLYSSVELHVLKKHVDQLIRFYYDKFIETLVKLKHDVSAYSFEIMIDEFANITRDFEFTHLLYMMIPILTKRGKGKDLEEFGMEDFYADENLLHESYFSRVQFYFLDFVKRGWL